MPKKTKNLYLSYAANKNTCLDSNSLPHEGAYFPRSCQENVLPKIYHVNQHLRPRSGSQHQFFVSRTKRPPLARNTEPLIYDIHRVYTQNSTCILIS